MSDPLKKVVWNLASDVMSWLTGGGAQPAPIFNSNKDSVEVCEDDPYARLFAGLFPASRNYSIFDRMQKDDDEGPQLFMFPLLGLVRVFGSRAGNKYETRFLFPNLDEVSVSLEVDSTNNVTVNNEGTGFFKDHKTGRVQKIKINKVDGFAGRIRLQFKNRPPMELDLTVAEPTRGSAMGKRLVLSNIQPEYSAPEFFTRPSGAGAPAAVEVKHVEFVGDSGMKGERGGIRTWNIILSNGDVIEAEVFSDHAGKGTIRPHAASLNRIDANDPGEKTILNVSGARKVTIVGEGYELEVPFTIRGGSKGSLEIVEDGIKVIKSPEITPLQKAAPLMAEQPTWLVPTKAGLQMLNRPLWGEQDVQLSFVGEIGGLKVDELSSLVIKGHFQDGVFVPNFEGRDSIDRVIFAEGHRLNVTLKKTGDRSGFTLHIQLGEEGFIEAGPRFLGRTFGFGTSDAVVKNELSRIYERGKVTAPGIELRDRNYIPAERAIVSEVVRFISRNAVDLNDTHAVTVQDGRPSVVRVDLGSRSAVFFERSERGGEIAYRLLVPPGETGLELMELPANGMTIRSLEGIIYRTGSSASVVSPWRGDLFEVERDGRVVTYQDWADSTVEARVTTSGKNKGVEFVISKKPPVMNLGGSLAGIRSNGTNIAIFELEDGRTFTVTLPRGGLPEDGIFKIAAGADIGASPEDALKVEIHDIGGKTVFSGTLFVEEGAWVVKDGAGRSVFSLEMDIDHASTPRVKLMGPPVKVVTEIPTVEAPEVTPPPETAERPLTVARRRKIIDVAATPLDRTFPWEEGAFMLPAEETRMEMRRAYSRSRPQEGEKARFRFYGGPEGSRTFSAREINASMQAHGERSSKYFQWELFVDMTFTGGEWVPDAKGRFNIIRRFPMLSGRPGFFRVPFLGGEFPIRTTNVGTGWGLVAGRDKVIQPFRTAVEHQGEHVLIPDFGISLGGPSDPAIAIYKNLAARLLEYGELQPSDFFRIEKKPIAVDVQLAEDVSGRLTPDFGDPIFRGSTVINGNISIVEFSPGYSEHVPDARFTQLQVYDGNGFNWRLVYQHNADGGVRLIACESFGKRVDVDKLAFSERRDGTIEASGVLPARYSYAGGGHRELGIPFTVKWRVKDKAFSVESIVFDRHEMGIMGVRFDPSSWGESDIFMAREGTNIGITTTILTQKRPALRMGISHSSAAQPAAYEFVGIPENHVELAKGELAAGGRLPETVKVRFKLESADPGITGSVVSVSLRYDKMLRAYVPQEGRGLISVEVNDSPFLAQIKPSRNGQNYELLLPVDPNGTATVYLGNFAVKESLDGNRPVPVIWTSDVNNANRGRIKRIIEEKRLGPEAATRVTVRSNADFTAVIEHGPKTYKVPMKLYQRMDGKYLVVIRGGAVCEEGGASRNAAVRYYLPYYGAAPAIELDGNSFEIRLDAGRETPLVTFLWSTPGENALHTEGRSRSSVMVEATDQSARVLIDLNPTSFAEEVGAALRSEGETLARRVLNDAISNRIYELVFSVKKGPLGLPELEIAGIAEVSMQGGITPIPFETVTDGTGIFVRMPDGHAFSVNKFPSSRLQVASYGRVLDRRLLSRVWSFISAPVDIFLGNIAMLPAADDPSFYMIERNRLTARDAVAKRFRVVPETIWDMKSSFPKGLTMHKQGWDPQRSQLRTYDRGPLHMDVTLSKNGMQIDAIRVTYQLNESTRLNIPAELFTHNGRPFIGLGGPFAGVVFYADAMRGRPTIREVTHPAVREALERDLGREPMGRPRFKADTSGHVYEYPPLEGGLAEAVNKQLRMSRMWRLKDGGVLPDDTAERERLADMLFPDSGTRKPEAIEVLEKVARNPVVKETVKKILGRLARGELDLSGMDGLNRHWGEYEASPSLYSLARVGFELCKLSVVPAGDAAAKKAVMLDTRKRIMSAPIGKDVIVELIRKTHGEALLKYLGVENASVSSLEELSVLIRGKVGETGWNKLHSEIEGYEREGRLAMHEEIGLLLEAAQAGLEGTGYNPQKGARRMRAFSERLKISVVAPTDGFSWSSTGANGYLNGIGTTALPDMVRSLDGGKVDPKDISRDGPQRVCSARDGGSSVMSDVLKRFRETQKAARKAGETAGRARKK